MPPPPPSPDESPERPDEPARRLREQLEEKKAVVERIKRYVEPWKADRRMKVMGEILLREIERIEAEEAERTRREGRP